MFSLVTILCVMALTFEWDEEKAYKNLKKHQMSFHEGATVFDDPAIATLYDSAHSEDEDRYISLGQSHQGRLLVISDTQRDECIRLISCRKATRRERKMYEKEYF